MAMTDAPPAATRARASARPSHGPAPRLDRRNSGSSGGPPRRSVPPEVYRRRRIAVGFAAAALVLIGVLAIAQLGGDVDDSPASAALPTAPAAEPAADAATDTTVPAAEGAVVAAAAAGQPETGEPARDESADLAALDGVACQLDEVEVKRGDTGEAVECAQRALLAAGHLAGEVTGTFDDDTYLATREFQLAVGLYVDGIVGRNTATELGIWPGQEAFIVRTPPPPAGATDLWGMPLSSVASAGDDAPPLPDDAGQGTGKRVVYERASQRVWAIDDEERIVRSYLVSGSQYRNEVPGVHPIYSKSESALGWDLQADLPYMIRYIETDRGHIGFHAIPSWRDTGEKLQTEDELGQKLSGGCTRQAPLDAAFLWQFADVGDKVWVL